MKQLLKNIKLLTVCLLVVSFMGCDEDDEANLPEVVAGFTYTLDEETATVTFINISEEADSYEWDFGDGETSELINPVKAYTASGTYTVSLEASNVAGASGVFEDEITIQIADPTAPFDSGLLTNGDFENGNEPWIGGGLNVATEGGNSFNLVDVTVAGNPFDVNLSQVVEITQGTNYTLTFDASASVNRTMLAGIGLNEAPFTNTAPSVNLTTDTQTFTLQLSAADFGGANSRVLFDMGAEVGIVVIDNVSLVEGGDGSDTNGGAGFDSGLLTNGDFESGTEPWIGGGLNVVTDGDNSFNSVEVTVAGNPFDVNLSQVVEITQGINYTLTFDASASVIRTMLAGIGLNEAPFTNTAPSVDLTTDTQTFTLQLSAADFGGANSRVLFDMGAEVGTVIIDNVSLVEGGDGSDSTSGQGGGSLEACDGGVLVNDFETSDDSIFNNFGGGVGTIIDNPDTSVNTSAKVAQYVKNAGEVFGGITIALESNVDLNNGTFSIDVNSQSVRQLLFKLEGLNQELIIPTSGTGWETISYDFTGNTGEVTGITLIMDNGTPGDGSADWTIQFDNIRLCDNESTGGGSTLEACDGGELVNDFETADDSIFNNFGGGVGTIIDNPDTSVNTSAKVAQYVKNAGEVFGGITIALSSNVALNNGTFSIDVNSQAVRQLLFKLEGLNQELIIPTSGTGWETISYDFTGNVGEVTGITLIMDNGTPGDGSADWTIQFDNIRLCDNESTGGETGGGCTDTLVAATALPLDFESCETFLASQNFGAGLTSDLVANPFKTGINTSDFVLQVNKPAGSDFFAGVQNTFPSNFDLTTTDTFKFKIYSTKANVVFRFELALNPQTDPVTGNPAPVFVTIPNANEWTEVEVTFTGLPGGPTAYNQLVIKPDNAQGDPAITADGTYYIDDIILE